VGVALADLAERYRVSLFPPGQDSSGVSDATLISGLVNGFWEARLRKWFAGYRVNEENEIVAVDGGDDLPEELHQLVVIHATLVALEAEIRSLKTMKRAKAGPVESETRRSPGELYKLIELKRAELADLRDSLLASSSTAAFVYVLDGVAARACAIAEGYTSWW
jgi:hypothetical protein